MNFTHQFETGDVAIDTGESLADRGACTLGERFAGVDGGEIEDVTDFKLMREFIDRVFRKYLTPRERKILYLYYGLEEGSEAMTLEKIGALLGVTRERIRQIRERAEVGGRSGIRATFECLPIWRICSLRVIPSSAPIFSSVIFEPLRGRSTDRDLRCVASGRNTRSTNSRQFETGDVLDLPLSTLRTAAAGFTIGAIDRQTSSEIRWIWRERTCLASLRINRFRSRDRWDPA